MFACTILALLPYAISGCGGGGGGGSSTLGQQSQNRVSSVVVTPDPGGSTIAFRLVSPGDHEQRVVVQISEDHGASYRGATLISGATTGLAATWDGTTHQVVWDPAADLTSMTQGDLMVRVTPTDEATGQSGTGGTSAVFALGANEAPILHSVETPSGAAGGEITIEYQVSDPQGDSVIIELAYSLDAGNSWHLATQGPSGDGAMVATSATPASRHVSWFSLADVPSTVSTSTRLRVQARDATGSAALSTGSFTLNSLLPRVQSVTVLDIPDTMNGSESYTSNTGILVHFHLQVPPSGFVLRVDYDAAPGGTPVDPASLHVVADANLGGLAAGTDLASYFTIAASSASWLVPSELELPVGFVTFTASIADQLGNISQALSIELEVRPFNGAARPFDTQDLWWLNFDADQWTISSSGSSQITITSFLGANGVPDFDEDLETLGLLSSDPLAGNASAGTNATMRALVIAEVLGRLQELYGGSYDGNGADLFNSGLGFTSQAGGHRSSIRVGGDDSVPGFTLGRAHFDHRNSSGNSNQSTTLGVFTTNLIDYYINASSVFEQRFDALIPGRGTPAGESVLDVLVLSTGFERMDPQNSAAENQRYDDLFLAIDGWGRAVAVVCAHEIGHSLGLCSNGPPPVGLFGGVRGPSWSGSYTNSFHFDSPGPNLMAAALSFHSAILTGDQGYRFNEVNEAYLREMILLD